MTGADEAVLVVAPDIANIRDARNLLDFLTGKRGESRATRLIINKSDLAKRTKLLPKDISNTLGVQPIANIPFDPVVFIEASNDGKMVGERFKSHKLVGTFTDLAMKLGARGSVKGRPEKKKFSMSGMFRKPQAKTA